MKKFLFFIPIISICVPINSYANTKTKFLEKKDNSRYTVAINSVTKGLKPSVIFGIKKLTKFEMNNLLSLASTPYGLGGIIVKRKGIGTYSNAYDKHIIFGKFSSGEGDMNYREDINSGIKYTFYKNEINISAPYNNGYCSYNLKKRKNNKNINTRYIIEKIPACFKNSGKLPYEIYVMSTKE